MTGVATGATFLAWRFDLCSVHLLSFVVTVAGHQRTGVDLSNQRFINSRYRSMTMEAEEQRDTSTDSRKNK